MKVLLDTHALLWLIDGDPKLSSTARSVFLDAANGLYWSVVSIWEVAIKISIGKLDLADDWRQTIEREMAVNAIRWLPIEPGHCELVSQLPFVHRDPFDRLLIAQAKYEHMTMLTVDPQFARYGLSVCW